MEWLPATSDYAVLLRTLDEEPYPLAVSGLAVLEDVYLQAWPYAAPELRTIESSSSTGRRPVAPITWAP